MSDPQYLNPLFPPTWGPLPLERAGLMNYERWTNDRSVLIKEWLSDYFYNEHPNGFDIVKYFPQFDRFVRIIQTGLDTYNHQRVVTARIRIYREVYDEYMEIELMYPI